MLKWALIWFVISVVSGAIGFVQFSRGATTRWQTFVVTFCGGLMVVAMVFALGALAGWFLYY